MSIEVYNASDYAGIRCNGFSAYYGYEEIAESGERCFVATINGEATKIPFGKLDAKDEFECVECLLYGIAIVLDGSIISAR